MRRPKGKNICVSRRGQRWRYWFKTIYEAYLFAKPGDVIQVYASQRTRYVWRVNVRGALEAEVGRRKE